MRIVHCIFGMNTGGAELLTVALVNELCHFNEVVVIVVNNNWDEEVTKRIHSKVQIYFLNRKEGSRSIKPILDLNLLLYKLKPDIIHCHDPKMGRLIKLMGTKLIYTIHAMDIPVDSYHRYDLLVAISDAVYHDVVQRSNVQITTIYNGVPIEAFQKRLHYGISVGETFKLVQVSRLDHSTKGQDILLRALAIFKERYSAPVTIDFVGKGKSLKYLTDLAESLGVSNNVNFIGEKNHKWLYENLATYHLLIQPSRYEGFGLTILEGLAAGLPVLASDIDGPCEVIKKTSGGFIFSSEDAQSCASQLCAMYELYLQNEMQDLVRRVIDLRTTEYSITSCTENYYRIYKRLLLPSKHCTAIE